MRAKPRFLCLLRRSLAFLYFLDGVHRLPAACRAAVAPRFIILTVIQVIFVSQLFAGSNVAQRFDPYASISLVRLTVRIAGMVDEHGRAMAIDHERPVTQAKQIGRG